MRTRPHDWYDEAVTRTLYSFQVFHNGKWRHVAENGEPLLFAKANDRDAARARYRRLRELPDAAPAPRDAYDTQSDELAQLRAERDMLLELSKAMEAEFEQCGCTIVDRKIVNTRAEAAERRLHRLRIEAGGCAPPVYAADAPNSPLPDWRADWLLDLMREWDCPLPTGMFLALIEKLAPASGALQQVQGAADSIGAAPPSLAPTLDEAFDQVKGALLREAGIKPDAPAPAGMVLVPREPTRAWVEAFMRHTGYTDEEAAATIEFLLAAAPAEPVAHADDVAVDKFAEAMKAKLAAARAKGRGGWDDREDLEQHLSNLLRAHVDKGDPRDVANFCCFLWNRGEAICAAPAVVVDEAIERFSDEINGIAAEQYESNRKARATRLIAALTAALKQGEG